ncbi:MAG: SDR family oxidoreductase [Phycisphaerales bacterium]|nr:SDR family oxidoreductase [Phycisphaerales bacterium]
MSDRHGFEGVRPLAIVTGGAKRVGRAIVGALARGGCDVLLTYRTSGDDAAALCKELSGEGGRVSACKLDLSNPDKAAAECARWSAGLPRIDVLVHNASIYPPSPVDQPLGDVAAEAWRVNALAPLLISRELAPRLAESALPGGGSIVAMLDIHAMGRPRRGFIAYSMAKAALHEMVRSLAIELAPKVRVNAVAPGVVAWPETGNESDAATQQKYIRRVPLARAGTPDEAAEAVRWLALDASYVTGQTIRVDGGRWLT